MDAHLHSGPELEFSEQEAWSQQYCDALLEQRFRLYQAHVLQPVDFKSAMACFAICLALGFKPVTVIQTIPQLWLLFLAPSALLVYATGSAHLLWYRNHRESVIMCGVFTMLVLPWHVLMPLWLAELDRQGLRAPAGILELGAALATTFLLLTFRIRLRILLPFSLLLAFCFCITHTLRSVPAYVTTEAATTPIAVFWAALLHLLGGILLPLWAASCMERRDRSQFMAEVFEAKRNPPSFAPWSRLDKLRVISPFTQASEQHEGTQPAFELQSGTVSPTAVGVPRTASHHVSPFLRLSQRLEALLEAEPWIESQNPGPSYQPEGVQGIAARHAHSRMWPLQEAEASQPVMLLPQQSWGHDSSEGSGESTFSAVRHVRAVATRRGTSMQQQGEDQPAWARHFSDAPLEQDFRLYQASTHHSEDSMGAMAFLALFSAMLFTRAPMGQSAPLSWLLLLLPPVLLVLTTTMAPHPWYRQHRETILMSATCMVALSPQLLIGRFWLPTPPDAQRLHSSATDIHLSCSVLPIIMLLIFRIRLRRLLPLALLLACYNIVHLILIAPLYQVAGVPGAAHIIFWGAAMHLTAGVLLPALVSNGMERRERRQFVRGVAAEHLGVRSVPSLMPRKKHSIASPFARLCGETQKAPGREGQGGGARAAAEPLTRHASERGMNPNNSSNPRDRAYSCMY